jgi:hypothetical protein
MPELFSNSFAKTSFSKMYFTSSENGTVSRDSRDTFIHVERLF